MIGNRMWKKGFRDLHCRGVLQQKEQLEHQIVGLKTNQVGYLIFIWKQIMTACSVQ